MNVFAFLWRWARVRRWRHAVRTQSCATCGEPVEMMFGLAGGGYGSYLICWRCSAVHKSLRDAE